jgi:hypothetical protein
MTNAAAAGAQSILGTANNPFEGAGFGKKRLETIENNGKGTLVLSNHTG